MAVTALLIAAPVLADEPKPSTSSTFSFKIKHQYVNGEDNDIEHKLSGGTLTISGELWASSCALRPTGERALPALVKIIVHEDSLLGSEVCSFAVTPSPNAGQKVSFKTTCANVGASSFYLEAFTDQNPETNLNCTIEATGTLTTK
jgi:hypothetical protein